MIKALFWHTVLTGLPKQCSWLWNNTVPPESITQNAVKSCLYWSVLLQIHHSGMNSSTSSWKDVAKCCSKLDTVYHSEETIEANFFCWKVFSYWSFLHVKSQLEQPASPASPTKYNSTICEMHLQLQNTSLSESCKFTCIPHSTGQLWGWVCLDIPRNVQYTV